MIRTNYHTHSLFCDGSHALKNYVEVAIAHNFKSLGFSSHSPITEDNGFSINRSNIPVYCAEIRALQEEYADRIEILHSFEFDYIPGLTRPMKEVATELGFDYILGSIHLVAGRQPAESVKDLWFTDGPDLHHYDKGLADFYNMDIQKAVKAFYAQTNQMLHEEDLTIIGHFDKVKMNNKGRYFSEEEDWYIREVLETLDLIQEKEVIVEVNTRGMYKKRHLDYFPSVAILQQIKKRNIAITLSSDAHAPEDIPLLWDETYHILCDMGFRPDGKYKGIEVMR